MNWEICNQKMNPKEEKAITDFVNAFILSDPFFKKLSKKDQKDTKKTFVLVMRAIFVANNYANVVPVLYAKTYQSAETIKQAIEKVAFMMPGADKIRIVVTN